MRTAGRAFLFAMALTVMSPLVSAYYYYVFFASGTGPYAPLAAHFDLNAIKDSTVQYFISDQAPAPLMPGDSLTSIYSQIRQDLKQKIVSNFTATIHQRRLDGTAGTVGKIRAVQICGRHFSDLVSFRSIEQNNNLNYKEENRFGL
jgi:hypothetical protein